MSSLAILGLKPSSTANWSSCSFYSGPRHRRISDAYRQKVRCCLGGRTWRQESHLLLKHYSGIPGSRRLSCTAGEGIRRILKRDDRVSPNFPSIFQASQEEFEKKETMDFEDSEKSSEELRSYKSRFDPFCSNLGMPSRVRSFMNHAFAGGYEREIIHKEVVRRLNSVGAADKSEENCDGSRPESDSFGSICSSYSDEVIVLEKGRYGQLGREEDSNEECITANFPAVGKRRKPLKEHDQQGRWARRNLLNHCIPAILEKLGLNFSLKNLPNLQGVNNNIYNVNVTVSYEMRYQLASEGGSQFLYRSETGEDFHRHDGKLPYFKTDSIGQQVTQPVTFLTSSKSTTGAKIRGPRKAINELEYGRYPSFQSNIYSDSQMMVPKPRRRGVRESRRNPGRLWLQADGDLNLPQSTMWRDMFTIIGLSAFIICGTYAFAVSNRYLKFGSKNKCTSMTTRTHCGSDSHSTPCLKQNSVIELSNCNFETSVCKKPTFVLFYAPWCSHCQQLEHTWKDLACRLPKRGFDVQLAQMDAEKYGQVAEKYKVMKYPTLIFFRDGKPTESHSGPRDVDSLMAFIDENYDP